MLINKEDKKVKKFIEQCADFCKKANLTSKKAIYDWLLSDLTETYKGRTPKWKIESVAEDLTDSIYSRIKGIRK